MAQRNVPKRICQVSEYREAFDWTNQPWTICWSATLGIENWDISDIPIRRNAVLFEFWIPYGICHIREFQWNAINVCWVVVVWEQPQTNRHRTSFVIFAESPQVEVTLVSIRRDWEIFRQTEVLPQQQKAQPSNQPAEEYRNNNISKKCRSFLRRSKSRTSGKIWDFMFYYSSRLCPFLDASEADVHNYVCVCLSLSATEENGTSYAIIIPHHLAFPPPYKPCKLSLLCPGFERRRQRNISRGLVFFN